MNELPRNGEADYAGPRDENIGTLVSGHTLHLPSGGLSGSREE
jgi:hypothetical protein